MDIRHVRYKNVSCIELAKFLFIHLMCLSVCAHSSSRKYSWNGFKLTLGIQVYYGVIRIENDACKIEGSCIDTHKRINRHYNQRVKLLKEHFFILILH